MAMQQQGTLERAFELAKSGSLRTVTELIIQLRREGYSAVNAHLDGYGIRKQLKELMRSHSCEKAASCGTDENARPAAETVSDQYPR